MYTEKPGATILYLFFFVPFFCLGHCKSIEVDTLYSPNRNRILGYVFSNNDTSSSIPIIFCHGWGGNNPKFYNEFVNHIVNCGYVLFYPVYGGRNGRCFSSVAHSEIENRLIQLVEISTHKIDTSRVGIIGHSFGGGMALSIAYQLNILSKWGLKGNFVWLMAPWYCSNLKDKELNEFSLESKFIAEVFEGDKINDPKIALELFRSFPAFDRNKGFIVAKNGQINYDLEKANHNTPNGLFDPSGSVNLYDSIAVFSVFDALSGYTFNNDTSNKCLLFGNGSSQACKCDKYFEFISHDTSSAQFRDKYINFFDHAVNPRTEKALKYGKFFASILATPETIKGYLASQYKDSVAIQPEMAAKAMDLSKDSLSREKPKITDSSPITISQVKGRGIRIKYENNAEFSVQLLTLNGRVVLKKTSSNSNLCINCALTGIAKGRYILQVITNKTLTFQRLVFID